MPAKRSEPASADPRRPVTVAVVGAGNRGGKYAEWIAAHPDRARVVAVADPREHQRRTLAEAHGVPEAATFNSWQDLVAAGGATSGATSGATDGSTGRLADAALVCTQDHDHVEPAVALAAQGYHLMVEKPLAPTEEGCRELVDAARLAGVLLAVGHVLRYTPYTRLVKQVLDSGRIGQIMNVQHLEPVGYWHQAHSYVRGNWRNVAESSPMLLAKSCHDIDWLGCVIGRPATRVSSFGRLSHFRKENQPTGAADRCLDCAVEPDCPYSASRFYLGRVREGRTGWPVSVLTDDVTEEGVTRALREGPYGRCVYTCDNDVVDHQVVALQYGDDVTATFTMTAFSEAGHRRTQIFGTRGSLDCDGERVTVTEFVGDRTEVLEVPSLGSDAGAGHGGGDAGLMDAFFRGIETGDAAAISSGPAETLASHLTVFAAERARHTGRVEPVKVEPV